jgi:hypothetical protein
MHKCLIVAASVFALAATSAPAWAGWGCGYTHSQLDAGEYGVIWSSPSEPDARQSAMKLCTGSGHAGCRVVSCSANVDTREQARAIWPIGGAATTFCLREGRRVPANGKPCN